jgi:methionyl-tRNA formyltransferase
MLTTVFFGTPASAVPFLERLQKRSRVLGVVSSPDKPAGRGYAVTPPPVKVAAERMGLPVVQPPTLKGAAWGRELPPLPDLGFVVAYGKLIPATIFGGPRFGLINAHFSLLPRYRGAGPVQWALIRGERETGVSFFQIEAGLDTGPIYIQKPLSIETSDATPSLLGKLTELGLGMLDDLLVGLDAGSLSPTPQTGEPTLAPLLEKDDGRVRWSTMTAVEIVNRLRGVTPWPGLFTMFRGAPLKILAARAREGEGTPGRLVALEKSQGLLIQCLNGRLLVERVKPDGKKDVSADDFWNGARLTAGDMFE